MRKRVLSLVLGFVLICCVLFALKNMYYQIDQNHCRQCGRCTFVCPTGAIQPNEQSSGIHISPDLCTGCGACYLECSYGAIYAYTGYSDDEVTRPVLKLVCNPNPMRSYIDILVTIPNPKQKTELSIVNSKGQYVLTKNITTGNLSMRWNGRDAQGKYLPRGVYFVSLICGKARTTNKITLVR